MLKIFINTIKNINNITKNTKNKFSTKTQVLHIPNNKQHIVTYSSRLTWLGWRNFVQCSCVNCVINNEN